MTVGGLILLAALFVASLYLGSGDLSAAQVTRTLGAWLGGQAPSDTTSLIILERRVPRGIIAITAGAALGLAGTLMQALTRNPLADPGLLGVSVGAYAAIVVTSAFIGVSVASTHVWAAMIGALVVAALVYAIGTTGPMGGSAVKLVLAGVAVGAVLQGLSATISLSMPEVFDRVRFWAVGSLQGRTMNDAAVTLPFILVGALIALVLQRSLNALALGDDNAIALGSHPTRTRIVGLVAVTLLTGAATAAAGPLAFVGLIVPHALRMLVGPDHRRLIPLSMIAAPVLLLSADILGRLVLASELPAGTVTAIIGAPVLIALVRSRAVKGL